MNRRVVGTREGDGRAAGWKTVPLAVCVAVVLAGVVLGGSQAVWAQNPSGPDPGMPGMDARSAAWQRAVEDVAVPSAKRAGGSLRRIGFSLAWLHHAYEAHRKKGGAATTFISPVPGVTTAGEWVAVDALARDDAATLQADLEAAGLRNGAVSGRLVSGLLPVSALDKVAELASLHTARPVLSARRIGSTTSQGVQAFGGDALRTRLDVNGDGARVGLISDSYDTSEEAVIDASFDVRTGDLPGENNPNGFTDPVQVLEDSEMPQTDEGRAMAQIVHDVAPGAGLLFHSAFNGGSANYAQAIRDLADAGATTIVDDVLFIAEPMFQDGVIAQAVDDVVFGRGVSYVTSAGNNGSTSYQSPFRDSGVTGPVAGGPLHDFDPGPGVDTLQSIRVPDGVTLQIALHWNQPAASVGGEGASTDLEIYLVDDSGTVVAPAQRRPNVGGNPFEFLTVTNSPNQGSGPETYGLAIERVEGPAPSLLKYVPFTNGSVQLLEYDDPSPTLYGHPNARGAIAVGAAAYFNTPSFNDNVDRPVINSFSSQGGIPVLFDDLGRRVAGEGEFRQKPDVTGPDGGNTTFFGRDLGPDFPAEDDDFPNFFGTSASAPHVAGMIALMQSAEPSLAPRAYADALRGSAVDVRRTTAGVQTGAGPDSYSGAGFVDGRTLAIEPPQVTDFTAEAVEGGDGTLRLTWRERETQDDPIEAYVVEQSALGGPFTRVGTVRGAGAQAYAFEQSDLDPGIYDYRLQVRRGGELRQGPRTRGTVPVSGAVRVKGPYPNPVTRGAFRLQITVPTDQGVVMALYDALGRRVGIVYSDFLRANRPRIARIDAADVDRFASGLHFVRIVGEEFDTSVPVMFVR